MTAREKKTPQQRIDALTKKLQTVKTKVKNMERAKRTRQLILQGEALMARAAAGDPVSQAEWDRTIVGLTRDHDRAAFDLEPLPGSDPDHQQPVNPPPGADLSVAEARISRAISAWTENSKIPNANMEPFRVEMRDAIVAFERLSGTFFSGLKEVDRRSYGLGDRPGVLLEAVGAS
jgi:hypothetical protein